MNKARRNALSAKIRIGVGHHLYEATVRREDRPDRIKIEIEANNREQAAHRAEIDGWVVCDMNMIG